MGGRLRFHDGAISPGLFGLGRGQAGAQKTAQRVQLVLRRGDPLADLFGGGRL
jgi:hypothetical protein